MTSLADGLPADVAKSVHPNWRANEAAFWAVRDSLLPVYRNQWIAFADGKVVASSTRPIDVFEAAHNSGQHPYVACVGREDEQCRMRTTNWKMIVQELPEGWDQKRIQHVLDHYESQSEDEQFVEIEAAVRE